MPRHMPRIGTPRPSPTHELELEGVPERIGLAQPLVRLLSVEGRVDVPAACEDEPIAESEHVVEGLRDAGEGQWDPAGEHDRAREADPLVVAEVEEADRETDQRLPRPFHLDTYIRAV